MSDGAPGPIPVPPVQNRRIVCATCGIECDGEVNFCPNCGSKPNKRVGRTEFELGQIAALDTVKGEFLKWLGRWGTGITLALLVLGWFGIDHVVTDRVGTEVQQKLQTMNKTINDATDKAYLSAAKADIQSGDAQKTIAELDAKKSQLESAIADLNQRKTAMEGSIATLDAQKTKLATSLSDLQHQETTIRNVIESENLTTVFAKLRYDLYRVHELAATAGVFFMPGSNPPRVIQGLYVIPTMISYEKGVASTTSDKAVDIVEFGFDGSVTTFGNPGGPVASAGEIYQPFLPFKQALYNSPIESLNGIRTLRLYWGGSFNSGDEVMKAFEAMLKYVKEVDVQLDVNGVPLSITRIPVSALQQKRAETLNGNWYADVAVDVTSDYVDVKKLYDTRLAPPLTAAAHP